MSPPQAQDINKQLNRRGADQKAFVRSSQLSNLFSESFIALSSTALTHNSVDSTLGPLLPESPKQSIIASYRALPPWKSSLRSGFANFLTLKLWGQAALNTNEVPLSWKVMHLGLSCHFSSRGFRHFTWTLAPEQTFDLYWAPPGWAGPVYCVRQASYSHLGGNPAPSSLPPRSDLWQSWELKNKISCEVLP